MNGSKSRADHGDADAASESALLRSNTGVLDDPAPSVDFTSEEGFERRRRRAFLLDGSHAEFSEAVDQGRVLQCFLQGVDERVHDRLRRIAWCIQSIPGRDVKF